MTATDDSARRSNFAHLKEHDEQLVRLGMLAEQYFTADPNTCLLKLRQFTELLARLLAASVGIHSDALEGQHDRLRRLREHGILPREVAQLFAEVRLEGNDANHELAGDHRRALRALKNTWQIGVWFHQTLSNTSFKSGPFIPPSPPKDESEDLRAELARLRGLLAEHDATQKQLHDVTEKWVSTEAKLHEAATERAFWENLALEIEAAKTELEVKLLELQSHAARASKDDIQSFVTRASVAAESLELDEDATRAIIDGQLRNAGWLADSVNLHYGKGTRPEKNKNIAIAQWPTASGPADYVLFVGLVPVATVEAKRKNVDVSAALQQAKRYAKDFELSKHVQSLQSPQSQGGPWGEYQLPFAFSSNGRPFLRQLATRSGTWMCDLRSPHNLGRPLDGWYTPEGLLALLKRDEVKAHRELKEEGFKYGFALRHYQEKAILAAENAIENGERAFLLAMATGTGKTKTCIALIYRLLKTQRFRRVLFLVDRSALGEQATDAFKSTMMESQQRFAENYALKEMDSAIVDSDTRVHVATVQGLVQRVLYSAEGVSPPPVDQYDCIVVDECHRGYLLDREMSETEQAFRSFDDYISKYRRVLDYFDAVKIGLTATPALHTTQIFGEPKFSYGYREAVIDGYLVDHEPPYLLATKLANEGISWKVGEQVTLYKPTQAEVESFNTPDEITIEIEDFNRKVITENFNRVVCEELASEIDPTGPAKTLVFCVNDAHADVVVHQLKLAFEKRYGEVEDNAVLKITGAADKPLQLIRNYKNERLPNVAVTVDLLTTGVDVPTICNLVFLRRVSSRILFDQMLGRATRLCPSIGKEAFRIFDAVRIYEAVQNMTAMKPVVVNPKISFSQLAKELVDVTTDGERSLVRDQFVAKLQRKKQHLSEHQMTDIETIAGKSLDDFVREVRDMSLGEVKQWFAAHPALVEVLERRDEVERDPTYVSMHEDELVSVTRGYGGGKQPKDYIDAFKLFINTKANSIPALVTVLNRPRELTRKQLREVAMALDHAGFSQSQLDSAWRELTNQDMAATIVGYIRKAAADEQLIPYAERVDAALKKILAQKNWTHPQREWLKKIAAQTKANVIVDRAALEDPDQLFAREGGGFAKLNKMFDGDLENLLANFNESVWQLTG